MNSLPPLPGADEACKLILIELLGCCMIGVGVLLAAFYLVTGRHIGWRDLDSDGR
jgi:hypothetical protein